MSRCLSLLDKYGWLPVAEIAGAVNASLASHPRLIVTAPPGAGKSTLLPLTLLEDIPEGKILMLEPRRIAARQVAERIAEMLGEPAGKTAGYRVRFESKVSVSTRIEVITEGIMERMLADDPTLEGVAAVIFDEFHERSLTSDLNLALTREIQNVVRPDLKILVMSATIDATGLSKELDARHLHSAGRNFDVDIIYGEDFEFQHCADATARAIRKASLEQEGNILAFLPGQGEIMKCREILEQKMPGTEILTLYGMMSADEQRRVLRPCGRGSRRIYLASPIAETSLTIEGISVVVDSGLYRTPVFNPMTGLSQLATARISKDMATQRSGRAGRLCAGTCYRLWTKATDSRMADCRMPEILTADLAPMVLTASAWGEADAGRLPWITPPPPGAVGNAKNLLALMEAIDPFGRITPRGRRMAELPCHPRIAAMLLEAGSLSGAAADIAALLEERDPLGDETDADLSSRLSMLQQYRKGKMQGIWKRIDTIAAQYRRLVRAAEEGTPITAEKVGMLVATAYPERIAMHDERGHYRLACGGEPATLHPDDDLARHEFLAIASMGRRIFLAAPLSREYMLSKGKWQETAKWDSRDGKAIARGELRLGLLTLATRAPRGDARALTAAAVAEAAPKEGLTMFDFNEDVKSMQLRVAVVAEWHPELDLPDVSTESVLAHTGEWLPMYIGNANTTAELRKIDMKAVVYGMLSYEQQQALEGIAPTHIKLPGGRTARIHYRKGAEAPVVSARLQDCFGLTATPRLDQGKRPVLMELLSPGFKPVQLTQDMEGFWKGTYFEIRKELRRRYPKHRWPENPLDA